MSETHPRRTESVTDEHGRPMFATGGAVDQDGSLKVYVCLQCRREVVWAKSTRTSRMYLANVHRGQAGQRYYVKASAHGDCTIKSAATLAKIAELRQSLADIAEAREDNNADTDLTDTQRTKLNASLDRVEKTITEQLATLEA